MSSWPWDWRDSQLRKSFDKDVVDRFDEICTLLQYGFEEGVEPDFHPRTPRGVREGIQELAMGLAENIREGKVQDWEGLEKDPQGPTRFRLRSIVCLICRLGWMETKHAVPFIKGKSEWETVYDKRAKWLYPHLFGNEVKK